MAGQLGLAVHARDYRPNGFLAELAYLALESALVVAQLGEWTGHRSTRGRHYGRPASGSRTTQDSWPPRAS